MIDELEARSAEPAEALDPYDGVALGVECAWPEHLAVRPGLALVEAVSDASISIA